MLLGFFLLFVFSVTEKRGKTTFLCFFLQLLIAAASSSLELDREIAPFPPLVWPLVVSLSEDPFLPLQISWCR